MTFAGGADHKDVFEPGGLTFRGQELVVADTNHQRLVTLPVEGGATRPFVPSALAAPTRGIAVAKATEGAADARNRVVLPELAIGRGATDVHVAWRLPTGTGVNEGAPFRVRWRTSEGLAKTPDERRAKGAEVQQGFDINVTPVTGVAGATLAGSVDLVLCDVATHRVCVPMTRDLEMSFRVVDGAGPKANVSVPLPEAKP
jgi:hypothetical protein